MALIVLVVVILAGRALVSGLSGGEPVATGRSAPPTPTSTVAGPILDCAAANLVLSVEIAKTQFAVGEKVPVTVTLAHQGRDCLVDGSDRGRQVIVTSGADQVWSSADCSNGTRSLLLAGGDVDSSVVTWSGTRSAEGCPADLSALGPGTYSVVVTVPGADGATSDAVRFTVVATAPQDPAPESPDTAPETPEAETDDAGEPAS